MFINRILHIDDDPDARSLLKHYLEAEGYTMLQAEDGVSGLELARAELPDLILLDLAIPRTNGFAVLQQLKQPGPLMDVPVIVVSTLSSKRRQASVLAAQATAFLSKPVDRVTLLNAVRDCVGAHNIVGSEDASAVPAVATGAPSERVTVSINAGLSELIPAYMERRRNDVADLTAALERGDFPAIETIGHRMRGNGASMGFAKISQVGEALEAGAQKTDRAAIDALRLELLNFLDHVDIIYD